MAVYKVPQDVEADDKLLGPFSFKQFIFLVIAIMSGVLAWGLSQLFLPLAIIPIPVAIFFAALALPLRKDQPTEVYLAAVISFLLKPRVRIWEADGISSFVEITASKAPESIRLKELSHDETEKRLEYLANLVDSRGWSVRGIDSTAGSPLHEDIYLESQQIEDSLVEGEVAQSFDAMLDQASAKRRQQMAAMMSQPASASTTPPIPNPYDSLPAQPTNPATSATVSNQNLEESAPGLNTQVKFSPYPESMRQAVINPTPSTPVQAVEAKASQPPTSPDIINLANNSDLSIETIAHEAKRIREREGQSLGKEEVVISLR